MAGQLTLTLDRDSRPHAAAMEAVIPLPVDATESTVAAPASVRRITTAAVLAVALVAALASYEHMRALASLAGEGWRSWLLPISVDGLAVAASMTMLVRRRARRPAGVLPWVARCCWA